MVLGIPHFKKPTYPGLVDGFVFFFINGKTSPARPVSMFFFECVWRVCKITLPTIRLGRWFDEPYFDDLDNMVPVRNDVQIDADFQEASHEDYVLFIGLQSGSDHV